MIRYLRCIEVEIHSYCNRKCQWCPNNQIDRTFYEALDETAYISLLKQLKEVDYSGVISYSRCNEPLADIPLLKKRLRQARKYVRNARLVTNTNGDYLESANLNDLHLDELTVMDYDCKGLEYCMRRLEDLGATVQMVDYPYIKATIGEMRILYYLDWTKNASIVDRGGALKESNMPVKWENSHKVRKRLCLEPLFFIGIDYNGNVTPCCEIRSDIESHRASILGNIKEKKLKNILESDTAKEFRYNASHQIFEGINLPCLQCQKDEGRYTRDVIGIDYGGDVS